MQPEPEQQIILKALGYLTPTKCNPLGKIIFSFFCLGKDTTQKENQLGKTYKTERKSTKKPGLGNKNMGFHYTLLIL